MDNPVREESHRPRGPRAVLRWTILLGLILVNIVFLAALGLGTTKVMQQVAAAANQNGANTSDNEQLVSNAQSEAGSCGVWRWPVKTGTDADAPKVNLNSKTPTTVLALGSLPAPNNFPQNNRIPHSAEFTQFILTATLIQFKMESDSDYHLVLNDAQGNSMIVEIADPNCIFGHSSFAQGITNSRKEFNAKYNVSSSWTYVNIKVQITGIGFFDEAHGQTGMAPNAIELHPVMDVQFNPHGTPTPTPTPRPSPTPTATATPSPSPTSTATGTPSPSPTPTATGTPQGGDLIVDGGFEQNSNAWVYGGTYPPQRSQVQVHSGSWSLKVGLSSGQQGKAKAYQLVNVPSNITSANLSFWYWPATNDSSQYGWQEADVIDSSGHVLQQLFRNTTNDQTWIQMSFDLSSYKGQTIGIQFLDQELSNGLSYYTYMYVDDVSLIVS